ncbi:glycosyltransferase family 2 protein [Pseudotamlana carrageenivorans]|uniref:Glycosyltransferase family 2 protein n=1 Tax=Pseudotamlana carrageenivorans TaxID=2069432 RepID=A0A2I7SE19_9FLAO|nr:glycosyltransferase family A protein [Tamlana carrageenivorans]AUS04136.1 glycosyltransferase family 2 protein [Tamlana carrageenivorans]
MLENFSISVVIPVYNCEQFIEKAVNSALKEEEVVEVLIVNDGSTDSTNEILERLKLDNNRVKVFYHKNKSNQGRSASRNLGLQNAKGNYIAFLDADDYFLPNRFKADKTLFDKQKDADGVYNAVGFHFYREATAYELKTHTIYTVTREVLPEQLFKLLLYGKCGHFHINGLTVKRSIFDKTGLFNEALVVAEDTELFWKMAITSKLYTGIITKPLAIRGVHDANVFDQNAIYKIYTLKMYEALVLWCSKNKVDFWVLDDLYKWIWILKEKEDNSLWKDIVYWMHLFIPLPKVFFSKLSIKYFPVIRFRQKLFPFLYRS